MEVNNSFFENETVELKSVWKDEYLKQICGFANSQGGILYIGINDNGKIKGINNPSKLLKDIPSKIISQLGIVPSVSLHNEDGLKYISVIINKSDYPVSYKGRHFVRSGSTTQELNGASLHGFLLKKQNVTWDELGVPGASFDDIDKSTVERFINSAVLANRIVNEVRRYEVEELFEKLNLVDIEGNIKRAAILAFSKEPTKYFPSIKLKIGRFVSDTDILTQDIIEGNLFSIAENIITILKSKYLKSVISYDGIQRIEILEYPEKALREAIFNAIVHRDYTGPYTQMRVNNSSLSIWNAGQLPEQLSIDSLRRQHISVPRNRAIADLFFRAGYIEAWGRGMFVIFNECRKHQLPEPNIKEQSGGFFIEFFLDSSKDTGKDVGINVGKGVGKDVGKDVSKGISKGIGRGVGKDVGKGVGIGVGKELHIIQTEIVKLMKANPKITTIEIAQKTDRSKRSIERHMAVLRELSIIKRVGGRKKGYWEVSD